jgi:tetratricopeptide (TPR) repeat protein
MRLMVMALGHVVALVVVTGCKSRKPAGPPPMEVDPVTEAAAKTYAESFAKLAIPCDQAQMTAAIDAQAMAAKFAQHSKLPNRHGLARSLAGSPVGARIVCAWMNGIEDYKLLRVVVRDGEPRPIMRRTIRDPRSGALVFGYDELHVGTTRKDKTVRMVDAFSYVQGQWITELIGGNTAAMAQSLDYLGDLPLMAETVRKARDLQRSGNNAQALEIIDSLPTSVRNYRGVQLMRIRAAAGISPASYKQALDELATVFQNDPSIAMIEADGAFQRGDLDAALKWIDVIDKAIGGDAFQEAHRALAYLRKGEIDKARVHADRAIAMEPTLARGHEVKLDIAIAQQQWSDAIAIMTELESKHGVAFDDAKLRAQPAVAGLVASPEYKAWRAKHP